jgi:hypothetical protein
MNIKELAEQAGYKPLEPKSFADDLQESFLQRFAELVAAAEREACIKLLEDFSKTNMVPVKDTWCMGLIAGANAIRARGEK